MAATTDQKARLLDLTIGVLELTRDGNRNIEDVNAVLQVIKNDSNFASRLLAKKDGAGWPVWKTLTIGGLKSKELLKRLEQNGFYVSNWAKGVMGKTAFTTLAETHNVALVRVKVRDLGFKEKPTTIELFARAKEQGLDLCPAEVGPHLRLALMDQLRGEWVWVAMEPITDSDDYPRVFRVERLDGGEQWLSADYAHSDTCWNLESEVVFCLRK